MIMQRQQQSMMQLLFLRSTSRGTTSIAHRLNAAILPLCSKRRRRTFTTRPQNGGDGRPLSGITILDMSRVLAGPYATQLLSDLGAQVIKIESPEGDDTRQWGPPFHQGSNQSAYFMSTNRNKHSVCIDLRNAQGAKLVQQLAIKSDVFIENFKVGGLKKFGLDYESLHALNPSLIYCSISGYGQNGPRKNEPGYDFVMQAKSGLMSITGADQTVTGRNTNASANANMDVNTNDGANRVEASTADNKSEPFKVGTAIVDVITGMYAVTGILSCLVKKLSSRAADDGTAKAFTGEHIDLALYDVSLSLLANQSMNYLVSGNSPRRLGNRHPSIVPYEMFETMDGQIVVAVGNDGQFQNFVKALYNSSLAVDEHHRVLLEQQRELLLSDGRFKTNKDRVVNRSALLPYIESQLALQNSHYWEQSMLKMGVPCSRVNTIQQAFQEEQVAARNMIWEIEHKESGSSASFVGQPIHLCSEPLDNSTAQFSPDLGEHTNTVLKELLGATDQQLAEWRAEGAFGPGK